jgi:hypothetical protein
LRTLNPEAVLEFFAPQLFGHAGAGPVRRANIAGRWKHKFPASVAQKYLLTLRRNYDKYGKH